MQRKICFFNPEQFDLNKHKGLQTIPAEISLENTILSKNKNVLSYSLV